MDLTIVAGQTRYLDFALKDDGDSFNASCYNVSGIVRDNQDNVALLSSCEVVTWLWTTCSQVRYAPCSCTWKAGPSPYSLRFRVVNQTTGEIHYYPSAVEFNVTVQSQ